MSDGEEKSLRDEVIELRAGFRAQQVEFSNHSRAIEALGVKLETALVTFARSRETNWPTLIAAGGFIMVILGGGWAIIKMQTELAVAPITTQNAISIQDRSKINDTVTVNGNRISSVEAAIREQKSEFTQKLVEIETQFRASDQIRNIQMANQQRLNFLMWNKSNPDNLFPADSIYYPHISQ